MVFLLNFIIAIVVGFMTDYVLARIGVTDPVKIILAVLVAIAVLLANFASRF